MSITSISQLRRDLQVGRITRRSFLHQVAATGLSASTVALLLDSCSSSVPQSSSRARQTELTWWYNGTNNGSFDYLVQKYKKLHPSVTIKTGKVSYDKISNLFQLDRLASTPDIFSIDIVWLQEFIAKNWIKPLQNVLPRDKRKQYLQIPMDLVTQGDTVWAAPLHSDIGLLYRLTDLAPEAPQSLKDMQAMAMQAMNLKKVHWGFYWQGAYDGPRHKDPQNPQGEALMANIVEIFSGFQAAIFKDAKHPQADQVTINSFQAKNALETMLSWLKTISPTTVLSSNEAEGDTSWKQGQELFCRSWPYLIYDSNDSSQSTIYGRFDISGLPACKSCLGGWQMAINAYSKNYPACEDFINWMLQEEAQEYLAVNEGFLVTLEKITSSPILATWNPFFPELRRIYDNSDNIVFRPISPKYQSIADVIESEIYQALRQTQSVDAALNNAQVRLEKLL